MPRLKHIPLAFKRSCVSQLNLFTECGKGQQDVKITLHFYLGIIMFLEWAFLSVCLVALVSWPHLNIASQANFLKGWGLARRPSVYNASGKKWTPTVSPHRLKMATLFLTVMWDLLHNRMFCISSIVSVLSGHARFWTVASNTKLKLAKRLD